MAEHFALKTKVEEMKVRLDALFEHYLVSGEVSTECLTEIMKATVAQGSKCKIAPELIGKRMRDREADDLMVFKQIVRNEARRSDGKGYPNHIEDMIVTVLVSVCAGCTAADVIDARKEMGLVIPSESKRA